MYIVYLIISSQSIIKGGEGGIGWFYKWHIRLPVLWPRYDGWDRVLMNLGPAVAPMLLAVVGVEILRGATVLLLHTLVEVSIVRLSKFIHLYNRLICYKFRIGPSGSDLGSSMQSSPHHSPRNSSPVNAAGNLTNNLHKMVILYLTISLNLLIPFFLSFLWQFS